MINQKQKIIDIYMRNKVVDVFDKERKEFYYQRYKHKVEANFLKKAINSLNWGNIKVLDVACGTGRMLPEIFSVKKNIKYTCLDSSEEMVKCLIEKAKKLGIEKSIKIKIGDATKIPFKDNKFDIVFSYHLLWHLPLENQKKIVKEMVRVCKNGGTVIFDIVNNKFLWGKIKELLGKELTEGIYKTSLKEFVDITFGKNLKIEKLSDFPIKFTPLYHIFNILNLLKNILPKSLFHMIYISMRK